MRRGDRKGKPKPQLALSYSFIMTNDYRYILQPYTDNKSRYTCPQCGNKGRFVRYIDTHNNGAYIADNVGKCNRADNCNYHYPPGQYFADSGHKPTQARKWIKPPPAVLRQNVPEAYLHKTGKDIETNNLVKFLSATFGTAKTNELIQAYRIGTIPTGYLAGATVFWQIRTTGTIAYGKVMQYNPTNGKRDKYITTVWNALNLPPVEHFEQCLFGEHLLTKYPNKPVYIHESEKTAIIASVFYTQYIHLACGGSNSLNASKCKALIHRTGCLLPDIGKYAEWCERWEKICKELPALQNKFIVANGLELQHKAGKLQSGEDLADYILTHLHEYKPVQAPNEPVATCIEPSGTFIPLDTDLPTAVTDTWETSLNEALDSFGIAPAPPEATAPVQPYANEAGDSTEIENDLIYSSTPTNTERTDTWQIQGLTEFFDTIELPTELPSLKITDLRLFVSSHIATVTRYNGLKTFEPHLNRLLHVKAILAETITADTHKQTTYT